jgi:hypothetical protein
MNHLTVKPRNRLFRTGRKCVETSDDVIEDDFTSTPDSCKWDFSPIRLGAAKTARESAKSRGRASHSYTACARSSIISKASEPTQERSISQSAVTLHRVAAFCRVEALHAICRPGRSESPWQSIGNQYGRVASLHRIPDSLNHWLQDYRGAGLKG